MAKTSIDETIEKMLTDESAQSHAVKALIDVNDRVTGKIGSDVELKTDLSAKEVCLHTAVDLFSHFLSMEKKKFNKLDILSQLITIKERKLLSKDRKSRQEIVDVAKTPEMNFPMDGAGGGGGFVKNFFKSKKQM